MEQNGIHTASPDKNNNRKTIVAVVILTSFATAFTGSSLNLSLPAIAFDYGQSATMVGWMVTIYALSVAAFAVPFGRIADITSRRRILLIGIAVFSACCGLSAVAPNFTLLLILRFAQGIGASMIFSTNSAIIISAFPPTMRGKAIGFNLAATYTGLSSGPVIGGVMNQHLGWRSIFVFTCILTLMALVLACLKVPHDPAQIKNRPLDLKGNLLFVVFIISFMYGLSQIAESLVQAVIFVAIGTICGILFIIHEYREEDPAVNVRLFKSNIGFGLSNLSAVGLQYICYN